MSATVVTLNPLQGVRSLYVVASWTISDPYALSGPSELKHGTTEVEFSLAADFDPALPSSGSCSSLMIVREVDDPESPIYCRARSINRAGVAGEWSATEEITLDEDGPGFPPDELFQDSWFGFTPTFSLGAGSITCTVITARYYAQGKIVLFNIRFSVDSMPSSPAPSGRLRVAGIPVELKSGGKFAARANRISATSPLLAAKILDDGAGGAAVDIFGHGGAFVGSSLTSYTVTGMYESA